MTNYLWNFKINTQESRPGIRHWDARHIRFITVLASDKIAAAAMLQTYPGFLHIIQLNVEGRSIAPGSADAAREAAGMLMYETSPDYHPLPLTKK